MTKATEKDLYLGPYQDAHKDFGDKFDVTLWSSPISQQRRFKAFIDILPMEGKRILDAGCSRGDFAKYLLDKNVKYEHFIGVDGVKPVIEYAKGRKDLQRCEFIYGDFVANPDLLSFSSPDIVAISGSLNTMNIEQAKTVLKGAWQGCKEALVFNFLSSRCSLDAPKQEYPAKRLPTIKLIDWALDKTWAVQFFQNYYAHGHDATIVMQKPEIATGLIS